MFRFGLVASVVFKGRGAAAPPLCRLFKRPPPSTRRPLQFFMSFDCRQQCTAISDGGAAPRPLSATEPPGPNRKTRLGSYKHHRENQKHKKRPKKSNDVPGSSVMLWSIRSSLVLAALNKITGHMVVFLLFFGFLNGFCCF